MRSVGLALALILLGPLACGQGYQTPKDIDWENLEKVSWADAYRAVTTPGVREYLEELLPDGPTPANLDELLRVVKEKTFDDQLGICSF